jgi:transposase
LTTAEREELTRLRQRVKKLETERDMLQEATDFFATQSARSSDLWRRQRRVIR